FNSVATYRNIKISKFLAKNNFEQYVFCAEVKDNNDDAINNDIPNNAKIFRKKATFLLSKNSKAISPKKSLMHSFICSMKELFFSPERHIWWVLPFLPKMIKIIREENIKFVMVEGSPYSSLVGGYFLKKICGIRLILDFHDPWTTYSINQKQGFIRKKINQFWERKCVQSADLITYCSDSVYKDLANLYGQDFSAMSLPNGFDLDDFKDLFDSNIPLQSGGAGWLKNADSQTNNKIFLYAGKYFINSPDYNPILVIKSFIDFTEKYSCKDCNLVLVGYTDQATINTIDRLNCKHVKCLNIMPRKDVFMMCSQADVLIHFRYPMPSKNTIALKLCEYAIFNKPIINFNAMEGDMYDFIKDNELGESTVNDDIDKMRELLYKAYQGEINICHNPLEKLERYNYDVSVKRLADKIMELG
ncbi:MAG: glycosyltransferase, partial [Candidatus Cloacimonetes bacterium]|nr:glycosyltransferase [Candidatus Cloacimonadota bacterium]